MSANGTQQVGRLREVRRAAGLTQQELAERAGCSVSYVRLLEAGFAPGASDVLPRIDDALARALGLRGRRMSVCGAAAQRGAGAQRLAPSAIADAQRILNQEARHLLDERLNESSPKGGNPSGSMKTAATGGAVDDTV